MKDGIIRALPGSVADKIAAGEVVERPLSIVKELVENSIDAGATSLTVEISAGGKEYIRVTDNGCGIPKDQLELAFMRYATSKLQTEEDLDSIETLGFRGEALASIAAVSRTELITKTAGSKTGARIRLAASEILSIEDAACDDGTTIIVRDLFYNVPARQKFLKPDNTESALVTDYVSKMALAYPGVRMRLISNGSVLFSTPGKNSLYQSILTVYSARIASGLIQVAREEGYMRLTGYVSDASHSERNRKRQVFFVNGRLIKSRILEQAVADAYSDKLFEGQYPAVFLFLELDPRTLDVNIHPHKTEVRFYQEIQISEFIVRSIRKALLDPKALEIKTETVRTETVVLPTATRPAEPQYVITAEPVKKYTELFSTIRKEEQERETQVQEEIFEYNVEKRLSFASLTFVGQAFDTYLILKDADGLYLMDQHAAHERVMYETLMGNFNSSENASQQLLAPFIKELGIAEVQASSYAVNLLDDLGFELREFGPSSYMVSAIPGFMDLAEAEAFLDEFFAAAADNRTNVQAKKDAITMRSCKSAVKAHDHLSLPEIKQLLSDLDRCENPFSCPHGRPTFVKFTEYELEKMFKRK